VLLCVAMTHLPYTTPPATTAGGTRPGHGGWDHPTRPGRGFGGTQVSQSQRVPSNLNFRSLKEVEPHPAGPQAPVAERDVPPPEFSPVLNPYPYNSVQWQDLGVMAVSGELCDGLAAGSFGVGLLHASAVCPEAWDCRREGPL